MKIALICPSNKLFMPYVSNYEKILREEEVDYDVFIWDRLKIEDPNNKFVFADSKKGHQRNILDYYKYRKFLLKKLEKGQYNKFIVFGIQLSFFLQDLLKKHQNEYLIDIRDYNKILKFWSLGSVVENSKFTVISSPYYKEFLPMSEKYIVNHNTQITSLDEINEVSDLNPKKTINISNIGAIRDLDINIKFIDSLKDNKNINLSYHGEGDINRLIIDHIKENKINNVIMTGRYNKKEESALYEKSDFINVLRYNDGINNKTALPNRLYSAVIYGKPILAFQGTYLAKVVSDYNLGLVLDSFNEIEKKFKLYYQNFEKTKFNSGRKKFLQKVIEENRYFEKLLHEFNNN